jgi:hypothetical protein
MIAVRHHSSSSSESDSYTRVVATTGTKSVRVNTRRFASDHGFNEGGMDVDLMKE